MPSCKNDASRYYKGAEPSPKGNGWCAHAEKEGKRRKGRDGKMWKTKTIGKSKRWVRCQQKVGRKQPPSRQKHHTRGTQPVYIGKNNQLVLNITFQWQDYSEGDDSYRVTRPSNKALCVFLRSQWVKSFMDYHSQMVGVWDESKDNIHVFDKVVDMKHARVLSCVVEKDFIYVQFATKVKPYKTTDTRPVVSLTNQSMKQFTKCLKDVFNFSMRAGGFLSKKYPDKQQGDIEVTHVSSANLNKI